MAKQAAVEKQTFRGTVAELAGKIAIGDQVLNLQDVQFLTRIGSGSFAKKVGTAPGAGTRGGKRATIWEITPSARLSFDAHEVNATEQKASNASTTHAGNGNGNTAQAIDPKVLSAAVQKAVQEVMDAQAKPAKRRPGRPSKAEKEAESKAA